MKFHHSSRRPKTDAGFTLIELLVVISIIGVLVSLLLPAVSAAREAGRRTQCENNIKQIALAMRTYEGANRFYPPTMNYDPNASSAVWSVSARLLPYLEEGSFYRFVKYNLPTEATTLPDGTALIFARIAPYMCPSEANDTIKLKNGLPDAYPANYAFNAGTWAVYDPHNSQKPDGVFYCNSRIREPQITDGLSKTLMLAEVKAFTSVYSAAGNPTSTVPSLPGDLAAMNPSSPKMGADLMSNTGHTEWLDGKITHAGFTSTFAPNTRVTSTYNGQEYDVDLVSNKEGSSLTDVTYAALTARSYHAGSVNVAMMDGSVHSIADGIDLTVWRALSTRTGGENVTQDF